MGILTPEDLKRKPERRIHDGHPDWNGPPNFPDPPLKEDPELEAFFRISQFRGSDETFFKEMKKAYEAAETKYGADKMDEAVSAEIDKGVKGGTIKPELAEIYKKALKDSENADQFARLIQKDRDRIAEMASPGGLDSNPFAKLLLAFVGPLLKAFGIDVKEFGLSENFGKAAAPPNPKMDAYMGAVIDGKISREQFEADRAASAASPPSADRAEREFASFLEHSNYDDLKKSIKVYERELTPRTPVVAAAPVTSTPVAVAAAVPATVAPEAAVQDMSAYHPKNVLASSYRDTLAQAGGDIAKANADYLSSLQGLPAASALAPAGVIISPDAVAQVRTALEAANGNPEEFGRIMWENGRKLAKFDPSAAMKGAGISPLTPVAAGVQEAFPRPAQLGATTYSVSLAPAEPFKFDFDQMLLLTNQFSAPANPPPTAVQQVNPFVDPTATAANDEQYRLQAQAKGFGI